MYIAEIKPIIGRGKLCKFIDRIGYKSGLSESECNECSEDADKLWNDIEDITNEKVKSETFCKCKSSNSEFIFIVFTKENKRMFVCSLDKEWLERALAGCKIIQLYEKRSE